MGQMIQDEQTTIGRSVNSQDREASDWRSRKSQQRVPYSPIPQKPKRKRGKDGRKSQRRNRLEWRDRDREWETQQSHWKKYPQEQQKRVVVECLRLWL
ncbi:MAG: hypothetical protein VKJ24_01985 [Synechococcales bacterium]|nr:hypothetical protein [Synechococcales bacterium]